MTTKTASRPTTDQILSRSGVCYIVDECLTYARTADLHTVACYVEHRPSDDAGELCAHFGRMAIETEQLRDPVLRGLVNCLDQLACYYYNQIPKTA